MQKYLLTIAFSICTFWAHSQIELDSTTIEQRTVATHLDVPWDMTYGSDGWIWFTELSGKISRVHPDTDELQHIYTVPDVEVFGFSAGMHAIVLHPDFTTTPHVYVHYTDTQTSSKIVRYTYDSTNNTLIEATIILDNIPGGQSHNGSRMIIEDDKLFIALGDAYSDPDIALDMTSLGGKFLRMNLDGSIPTDNPIADSRIWSWGHRNPQGFCKGNGMFYSSEHGTFADDEINIIESNRNFGWPEVEGACNTAAEMAYCEEENVKEPIWTWTPSIAPCGMDYFSHSSIPEWDNSLLLAVLKERQLIQLKLSEDGTTITEENIYLDHTLGRLRDVLVIPDGRIFVCTTNRDFAGTPTADDDKIIELKGNYMPTASNDVQQRIDMHISPNPATDAITINCSNPFEGEVRIFDTKGQQLSTLLITSPSQHFSLSIYDLPSGAYYLSLVGTQQSEVRKFVVY